MINHNENENENEKRSHKYDINRPTIIFKKYLKNCASYEKAVTTSETLTEYKMSTCTTITSNNCRL